MSRPHLIHGVTDSLYAADTRDPALIQILAGHIARVQAFPCAYTLHGAGAGVCLCPNGRLIVPRHHGRRVIQRRSTSVAAHPGRAARRHRPQLALCPSTEGLCTRRAAPRVAPPCLCCAARVSLRVYVPGSRVYVSASDASKLESKPLTMLEQGDLASRVCSTVVVCSPARQSSLQFS